MIKTAVGEREQVGNSNDGTILLSFCLNKLFVLMFEEG